MSEHGTRARNDPQPGFASRLDRPAWQRELQRRVMLTVPRARRLGARWREFLRRATGAAHVVDYFHQVDDAYSHLAVEAIDAIRERYDVAFRFHLVGGTDRLYAPEPELLAEYARRDCSLVAPHYELDFPQNAVRPDARWIRSVERMLAPLTGTPRFVDAARETGRALWRGDDQAIERLHERFPTASEEDVDRSLAAGNALRSRRRHYSGGMFWYAGEWYWGVDRLYLLEHRLIALGAARGGSDVPRFQRPALDAGKARNDGRLSLEIYPSLRSPYTAIIFEKSIELARSVGVPVTVKPVMPMVMRGVPAPAAKGMYITMDALREAEHLGVPFGNLYDPIGRPVERGFSLWPFANEKGRGAEFIAAFLRAAFVEGRDTGSDEGIRHVVEEAGLPFEEARASLDTDTWREELESNRREMYEELGVWGVPSYRLRGPEGERDLCVWGQDRLWLVAAEIRSRLAPD